LVFKLAPTNTTLESEVLASMYDSSLDQFAKGYWNPLTLDRYVYNSISYRNKLGFDKNWASLRNFNTTTNSPIIIDKRTQLMWFDLISLTQRLRNNSSVSKYLSKQNKNLENTNSISALLQMKTEIHYPAPASQ
jgi:hypothetical protein